MAFKSGHNSFVLLDGVAGTGINVSAYADNFSFDQPVDTHDVSVFGASAKTSIPGLTDGGAVGMSGPLDVALGTFVSGLKAAQAAGSASATLIWGPGGSVSGQVKQSAETWVTAYNVSTSVDGRVEYSCSLQVTGAVTNGTW